MSSGAWIEMIYNQNAFMPFVALAKSNAKFSLYFSVCSEGVFRDKHTESAPQCALCCGACGQAGSLSTQPRLWWHLSDLFSSEPLQMTKSPHQTCWCGCGESWSVLVSELWALFFQRELALPADSGAEADHRDTHLLLGATCVLVFWDETSFFLFPLKKLSEETW